jgi:hypothetical protein
VGQVVNLRADCQSAQIAAVNNRAQDSHPAPQWAINLPPPSVSLKQ